MRVGVGITVILGLLVTFVLLSRRKDVLWSVAKLTTTDGYTTLMCEKPGQRPWLVGTITPDEEVPGLRLAELRAQAEQACAELNAGRAPQPYEPSTI